mmetsp:Transcript_1814/g.5120  ORF Transcript_1814/g.5120 Transcript_1814/m.5120 type:complete len:159 (-) Transcript_1814:55-531(-)
MSTEATAARAARKAAAMGCAWAACALPMYRRAGSFAFEACKATVMAKLLPAMGIRARVSTLLLLHGTLLLFEEAEGQLKALRTGALNLLSLFWQRFVTRLVGLKAALPSINSLLLSGCFRSSLFFFWRPKSQARASTSAGRSAATAPFTVQTETRAGA